MSLRSFFTCNTTFHLRGGLQRKWCYYACNDEMSLRAMNNHLHHHTPREKKNGKIKALSPDFLDPNQSSFPPRDHDQLYQPLLGSLFLPSALHTCER